MPTFRQRLVAAMGNVSPLAVLFGLCVLFSLLTFVIPGGAFERRTVEIMGVAREIVVPGSFHPVPSVPQGFRELWTVFMRGAVEAADRSFVILLSAGAMTAVIATGAIDAAIHAVVRRTAASTAARSAAPGGHSSSTIATSEPRSACTRIDSSGVSRFISPSRCDRNVTPSSSISRSSASENT